MIPAYELDEVWIHVSGVPAPWHHYLAFWALGCVIGATQEVDMLTYRRTGVIRMKVFMHSSVVLPITTDVVFGKLGYPITYALENESFRPAKIMEVDQMDHDGDTQEDQDDSSRDGHHDQVHKKARNSENTTPPKEQSSDVTAMQLALTPLVNCQPLPPPRPVIADEKEVMTARSTPRIINRTASLLHLSNFACRQRGRNISLCSPLGRLQQLGQLLSFLRWHKRKSYMKGK